MGDIARAGIDDDRAGIDDDRAAGDTARAGIDDDRAAGGAARAAGPPPPNPDAFRFDWQALPAITADLPGTGGQTRACPDDFVVSEIPRHPPDGRGDYAYAYVEKRGLATHDLAAALRQQGVPYREIGIAGLKDKHAITRQWLSVPARHAAALESLDQLDGAKILETARHSAPLRRGQLRANRFEARVRHPEPDWQPRAQAILQRLQTAGLPNYFGPQRFGRFNSNAIDAVRLLRGEKVPGGRRLNQFFISALQSHLFNLLLKRRIELGVYDRTLPGDRAQRHDTGGVFIVDNPDAESARAMRLEISPLLPLYGRKVSGALPSLAAQLSAAALEQEILDALSLRRSDFRPHARGDWRPSRAIPEAPTLSPDPDGYLAQFTLPSGAYATNFLRELTKSAPNAATPPEPDE